MRGREIDFLTLHRERKRLEGHNRHRKVRGDDDDTYIRGRAVKIS